MNSQQLIHTSFTLNAVYGGSVPEDHLTWTISITTPSVTAAFWKCDGLEDGILTFEYILNKTWYVILRAWWMKHGRVGSSHADPTLVIWRGKGDSSILLCTTLPYGPSLFASACWLFDLSAAARNSMLDGGNHTEPIAITKAKSFLVAVRDGDTTAGK